MPSTISKLIRPQPPSWLSSDLGDPQLSSASYFMHTPGLPMFCHEDTIYYRASSESGYATLLRNS